MSDLETKVVHALRSAAEFAPPGNVLSLVPGLGARRRVWRIGVVAVALAVAAVVLVSVGVVWMVKGAQTGPSGPTVANPCVAAGYVTFEAATTAPNSELPLLIAQAGHDITLTPVWGQGPRPDAITDLTLAITLPDTWQVGSGYDYGVRPGQIVRQRTNLTLGAPVDLGSLTTPGTYPIVATYHWFLTDSPCSVPKTAGPGGASGIIGYVTIR